jgi:amino acid transporter
VKKDISAAGLLSYVLPSYLGVAILSGAAIALINDLPAMLLSVSRLMFAWAKDGIFPNFITKVHKKYHTPNIALILAGVMASIGILGSHFAGDFFLGIDIMITSMMVNFLLMSVTLLALPYKNSAIANDITVFRNRFSQRIIGVLGILFLLLFLTVHTYKDITSGASKWYFHSTPVWLIVMALASLIFVYKWKKIKKSGVDPNTIFEQLPEE